MDTQMRLKGCIVTCSSHKCLLHKNSYHMGKHEVQAGMMISRVLTLCIGLVAWVSLIAGVRVRSICRA